MRIGLSKAAAAAVDAALADTKPRKRLTGPTFHSSKSACFATTSASVQQLDSAEVGAPQPPP